MNSNQVIVLATLLVACTAQRSPYAGRRPVGYPEMEAPTTTQSSGLGNRFGNEVAGAPTTTQRLPLEARGDAELIRRLSQLPIDQQPFWFINWQALEAHRQKANTYQLRPNSFIETNNQILMGQTQPNASQNNRGNSM